MGEIKLAVAGDLHKRSKDITTIEGYVECCTAVQRSLMSTLKKYGIEYFISAGDWYDKGYAGDVSASLADYDLDIEMSHMLNGNFYGVIGNHIRLNLDSNPELHIIQPHEVYKPRRASMRDEQIMKTPEVLRIRDVQISLMHFNKDEIDALSYRPTREPWAKYHIAIFHTQLVIPNQALVNTNYGYNSSSNSKIGQCLNGVDLAIVGHVHDPIGTFPINTPNGVCTMIVPGSLTNVDAGERGRHSTIAMPLITIDDESNVKLEYIPFDLKLNLVTFKKRDIAASRENLKTLRGKPLDNLNSTVDVVASMSMAEEALTSLNAFMLQQGYTAKDKALIKVVLHSPESVTDLVRIYLE